MQWLMILFFSRDSFFRLLPHCKYYCFTTFIQSSVFRHAMLHFTSSHLLSSLSANKCFLVINVSLKNHFLYIRTLMLYNFDRPAKKVKMQKQHQLLFKAWAAFGLLLWLQADIELDFWLWPKLFVWLALDRWIDRKKNALRFFSTSTTTTCRGVQRRCRRRTFIIPFYTCVLFINGKIFI